MSPLDLIPVEHVQSRILVLRGQRVIIDRDSARLYGVTTKRLNHSNARSKRRNQHSRRGFACEARFDCQTNHGRRKRRPYIGVNLFARGNQRVNRYQRRFPADFRFQLAREECSEVVAKCDHLGNLRFSNTLPYAFTEHGAIQTANVINSATAEEMGVMVVRAFIQLRQMMVNHKALTAKLAELDARLGEHDEQIASLVEAIRNLTMPDGPLHKRKIGFVRTDG
ncbi:hypothetical protein M2103_000445 [Ereboglobus sp. PH5-5]|uniref:ORF6N domain-containing protein n=1 Tax=Ereboglobus sp. PH5-5 TaxID=2940529 RepID=UPI00240500A2|nr:ORF6N domain-containing protein [Ereboglobus sp. PH5-5]MDF9832237.1 hypothetical protein [Ereboglobus sp. PH5-5]